MSAQRVYQLLLSFVLITAIALLSERSRVLTSIASAMPINLALALWFVFTDTGGDRALSGDFCRMALLSLIPTMLFLVGCWYAVGQGWSLGWVVAFGYAVWLVAVIVYRGIEWWAMGGRTS